MSGSSISVTHCCESVERAPPIAERWNRVVEARRCQRQQDWLTRCRLMHTTLCHYRYAIVASYLFRTYPKLRVGYLSAIRQKLVMNVTLAKFARMYKMDQALEVGPGAEWYRKDEKSESHTSQWQTLILPSRQGAFPDWLPFASPSSSTLR